MGQAGFVQGVKARGKYYYYVRRAFRADDQKVKKINLIALGRKENALSLLKSYINGEDVPAVLSKYKVEEFERWIKYIEEKE